ncbi:MAG: hypothetical protein JOY66_08885 [Acetobacteraceae bacterium]|nr:hypothetical protein [Acetobacteraceae bacterium]
MRGLLDQLEAHTLDVVLARAARGARGAAQPPARPAADEPCRPAAARRGAVPLP